MLFAIYLFIHLLNSKMRSISFLREMVVNRKISLFSSAINIKPKVRDGLGKAKGYSGANENYIMKYEEFGLPDISKPYFVLGIETSCDDTGVAIVSSNGTILSNIVYSQYEVHEKFGGIVPGLAMEAHKSNINIAIDEALLKAGLKSLNEIDVVAVTKGPGLEICLRVGIRKAQVWSLIEYNLTVNYFNFI
jgi:N6-L-threonylcarbamoyladenine synthase